MKEPYEEGTASHLDPESCADGRKAGRDALTDGTIDIDEERVRRAGAADGRTVLLTNDDTVSPHDATLAYKAMALIETCFRKMKTRDRVSDRSTTGPPLGSRRT
jgi:hypothetical protein